MTTPARGRAETASETALAREEEAARRDLSHRLDNLRESADFKLEMAQQILQTRIDGLEAALHQYMKLHESATLIAAEEREKAAAALREAEYRALQRAEVETEKAAAALRFSMSQQVQAGDQNLLLHIEAQKEQVKLAFESSEKAIEKAEQATNDRFHSVNEFRAQLNDQAQQFVLREVYDQNSTDVRRRQDALLELVQSVSTRVTEIEARGTGQTDQAAGVRSTLAIVVAVAAVLASAGIGILALVIG